MAGGRRPGGKMVNGHYWHPDDGPMPKTTALVVKPKLKVVKKPKVADVDPDDFVAVAVQWLFDGGDVPSKNIKALLTWRDATQKFLAELV